MNTLKEKLFKNRFLNNILSLMTGTVIAQIIPIVSLPILTRLYSPDEFGLLALYIAIVSTLGVIATARYELAIMLPKNHKESISIVQLSLIISVIISLLLCVMVALFSDKMAVNLGNEDIQYWLYLVPISIFLTGCYQSYTFWNNRNKKYKYISISRVLRSFFQVFTQVAVGWFKISGGLIIGQIGGLFAAFVFLISKSNKHLSGLFDLKKSKILNSARKYSNFPKYGVGGALCDTAAVQMPVFILTMFFTSSTVGMFSLAFRVLTLPASLISSSLSQVLFQKIVEINSVNPTKIRKFIVKIFLLLITISCPLIPLFWLYGENLFVFFFGEEWRLAGEYCHYLVIAVVVRFCVSPLSCVMTLNENLKKGVVWQVLYFITITATLFIASQEPIEYLLAIFALHELVLYSIYFFIILNSCPKADLCAE